jgi:hypothetical protein
VEKVILKKPLAEDPKPPVRQPGKRPRVGKPPKVWDPDRYIPWARALARDGLNRKQIATKMRLGKTKFYEWIATYPEFANAMEGGREEAAAQVENAHFQRAIGFEIEETKIIGKPQKDKDGNIVMEEDPVTGQRKPKITAERVERVRKKVLGDVAAQQFILQNLRPKKWKNRQALAIGGEEPGKAIAVKIIRGMSMGAL